MADILYFGSKELSVARRRVVQAFRSPAVDDLIGLDSSALGPLGIGHGKPRMCGATPTRRSSAQCE